MVSYCFLFTTGTVERRDKLCRYHVETILDCRIDGLMDRWTDGWLDGSEWSSHSLVLIKIVKDTGEQAEKPVHPHSILPTGIYWYLLIETGK
jgi:hypothetical protein